MILNIKKYHDKLSLCIFGICINFSNKTLKKIYTAKSTKELEIIFDNVVKRGIQDYSNHVWIEYIKFLILQKDYSNAKNQLEKYSKKYKNLKDIDRYLIVANFAKKNGFSNKNIEIATSIYENLKFNTENNLFLKLASGKNVAIVGNGPSEIGKGLGDEIDSHDIVIRFNNYPVNRIIKDYGKKIDIHITINAQKILTNIEDNNIKLINFSTDITKNYLLDGYLEYLNKSLKSGISLSYFSDNLIDFVKNTAKLRNTPTSGFITLINLYKNKEKYGIKNINCYGFSFRQKVINNNGIHYYEKNTIFDKQLKHSFVSESEYIKKHLLKNFMEGNNVKRS